MNNSQRSIITRPDECHHHKLWWSNPSSKKESSYWNIVSDGTLLCSVFFLFIITNLSAFRDELPFYGFIKKHREKKHTIVRNKRKPNYRRNKWYKSCILLSLISNESNFLCFVLLKVLSITDQRSNENMKTLNEINKIRSFFFLSLFRLSLMISVGTFMCYLFLQAS